MVKGSKYDVEMGFIHEKDAYSILPKSGLKYVVAVTPSFDHACLTNDITRANRYIYQIIQLILLFRKPNFGI